jgi:hypothetical protein
MLIHLRATGPPMEFARKLGIRRSTLFQSLQEMKEMGVDIRYSNIRETYYYADDRRIEIRIKRIQSDVTANNNEQIRILSNAI